MHVKKDNDYTVSIRSLATLKNVYMKNINIFLITISLLLLLIISGNILSLAGHRLSGYIIQGLHLIQLVTFSLCVFCVLPCVGFLPALIEMRLIAIGM